VEEKQRQVARKKIDDCRAGAIEIDDVEFCRKDGSSLSALLSCSPIFESGVYQGALAMVMDFTERKCLQDQIQRNMQLLEEKDTRKNQFLATLAHELRNPLATINLATEHVLTNLNSESESEDRIALSRAVRQGRHLTRLVNDLLQISRITSGKIELRKKKIDLNAIIPEAIDLIRPRLISKEQKLITSLPNFPLAVEGDPVRLIQVCGNLLDNAIKFSNVGAQIEFTVTREGSNAVVSVQDNGVGIEKEHLSTIFELFRQMKHGPNRSEEGLGIGLALVRQLVILHGGEIVAHSDGIDRGSKFTVRLPLAFDEGRHRS
jgi:signal transduction histidine kinase